MDYRTQTFEIATSTDPFYVRAVPAEQVFVPHNLMIGDQPLTITFPSGATLSFKDINCTDVSINMTTDACDQRLETSITVPFRRAELIIKALPESISWDDVYGK